MANRYTIGSGNASNPAIWDGGTTVPVSGDRVLIQAGHTVTLDGVYEWGDDSTATIVINSVSTNRSITVNGTLNHSPSVNTSLTCLGSFFVGTAGKYTVGTVASPVQSGVSGTLLINKSATLATSKYQCVFERGSQFSFAGEYRKRWTQLTADVSSGTNIAVADATGWKAGDTIDLGGPNRETKIIAGGYVSGALTVPLTTAIASLHSSGFVVVNNSSNVTVTPFSPAHRSAPEIVTGPTGVPSSRVLKNALFKDLNGNYPHNNGVKFWTDQNYDSVKYVNPFLIEDCAFYVTAGRHILLDVGDGANMSFDSQRTFNRCSFSAAATATHCEVYTGTESAFVDCVYSSSVIQLHGFYNLNITGGISSGSSTLYAAFGGYNGPGECVIDSLALQGAYYSVIYPQTTLRSHTFKNCDLGFTYPMVSGISGVYLQMGTNNVQTEFKDCKFGAYPAVLVSDQATQRTTPNSYIKVTNRNLDVTQHEEYRYNYIVKRSTTANRSASSVEMRPVTLGSDATRSREILCAAGASIRVVGYVRADSTFYNGGGAGWTAPKVSITGNGVTTASTVATVNGASGVIPVFTASSLANNAWEKYDITVTNASGIDGNFTLSYITNPKVGVLGKVYFDGVPDSPFVTKCRHYGFTFDEANPVRMVNGTIQQTTEATAIAYTGISIAGATTLSPTTLTASKTFQQVYDYSQAYACANLTYTPSFTATGSAGSPALIALANVTTTGYTLDGGGSLAMGAYTLTANQPWAYTFTGGTFSQAAGSGLPVFSGGTLALGAAGAFTFGMTAAILQMTPTAPSTYNMSASSFSGTNDLRNTSGTHAITVSVPSGATFITTNNTGAAITVSGPTVNQSVTITGFTAGSRIQIYDVTNSSQLFNGTASSGATVVSGSTATWTDPAAAAGNRAIRVRVAYVSGVTANEYAEANIGTCGTTAGTAAVSYLVSPTADTTYNNNAVSGSTITTVTFTDAATDLVNCNVPGGSIAWKDIYAAFVYWNFTATGIANDFTYIAAPDTANYILTSMKVKNTSSGPVVPLTVTGGFGRDNTGSASNIVDTTGGSIFLTPEHVVPYQTTGSYAITGDISTVLTAVSAVPVGVRTELTTELARIDVATSTRLSTAGYTAPTTPPTAAAISAQVLADAATTPIASNTKAINGVTLQGAGTTLDPMRPV